MVSMDSHCVKDLGQKMLVCLASSSAFSADEEGDETSARGKEKFTPCFEIDPAMVFLSPKSENKWFQ